MQYLPHFLVLAVAFAVVGYFAFRKKEIPSTLNRFATSRGVYIQQEDGNYLNEHDITLATPLMLYTLLDEDDRLQMEVPQFFVEGLTYDMAELLSQEIFDHNYRLIYGPQAETPEYVTHLRCLTQEEFNRPIREKITHGDPSTGSFLPLTAIGTVTDLDGRVFMTPEATQGEAPFPSQRGGSHTFKQNAPPEMGSGNWMPGSSGNRD